MRSLGRGGIALVSVVALIGAACSNGPDAAQKTTGPYAVGTTTAPFVDTSRAAAGSPSDPSSPPGRVLDTNIWYPAQGAPSPDDTPDAAAAPGPFPLIVFSHGQAGEPQLYQPDFHLWAQAGYVIAAPRHPLTIKGVPGGPQTGDIVNQPEDVSFVISMMGEKYGKLVDVNHVAVAGHSSGAITAMAAGLNTCCRDKRVDAVVLEGVLNFPFPGGTYFDGVSATPVMFFHGDSDAASLQEARDLYAKAKQPKYFVTIAGGDHSAPYRSGPPDPHMVADVTLAFLDHYLKHRGVGQSIPATIAKYPFAKLETDA